MKKISAEILSTGDEVLLGAVADTNSAHIASVLAGLSMPVSRHTCVGDELSGLVRVMEDISKRADVCVVTGGLGPTFDDRSSEAAALAGGVEQVLNRDALAWIEAIFEAWGRPMPESNRRQAMFPEGAEILANPIGTAPGFTVNIGACRFFFLPGVPREMRLMLAGEVIPRLRGLLGETGHFGTRAISLFGTTEASIGEQTADLEGLVPGITVGLQASFPVIRVKIYARGESPDETAVLLDRASDIVVERLSRHVVSVSGKSLEEAAGELLRNRKATVAVAESCTGGLVSHLLTQVPGASDYFLLGAVTYANQAKTGLLGVSPQTLAEHGAVSGETASEMAEGARRAAGADYGISTTGIAGPTGGSAEKPVGTVCIGLATPTGVSATRLFFPFGDRDRNKSVFAASAINILRQSLLAGS